MLRATLSTICFAALGMSVASAACDSIQLDTNMIWCYNIGSYRTQIQNALLNSDQGAAAQSIMQTYRACQHGDALKWLNSCGPLDFLQSARRVSASH